MSTANKPIVEFRSGRVKAAVWAKDRVLENGSHITDYSVSLSKSYKDKEDKWQETTTFFPDEIPQVVAVMDMAYRAITVKQTGNGIF